MYSEKAICSSLIALCKFWITVYFDWKETYFQDEALCVIMNSRITVGRHRFHYLGCLGVIIFSVDRLDITTEHLPVH